MALDTTVYFTVYSNDGAQQLARYATGFIDDPNDYYAVNETGIVYVPLGVAENQAQWWTYEGGKIFLGLATEPNASQPTLLPGDIIHGGGNPAPVSDQGSDYYIVERANLYRIEGETLSAIADSIRAKTGGAEKLAVSDFAGQIEKISTGITPEGTLEISENGSYDVTGYASANVSVSGSIQEVSQLPEAGEENEKMVYLYTGESTEEFVQNGLYMCERVR